MPRTAISPPMPRWCWPSRRGQTRVRWRRRSSARLDALDVVGIRLDRRAGLHQPALTPATWRPSSAPSSSSARTMAVGQSARALRSTSNMSPPTPPGRCTWAIAGARWWATRWRRCWNIGHKVIREYYINDAGGQVDVLARSVHLRYREALGEDIGEIPEGLYPGAYLVPVGQALATEFMEPVRRALKRANGSPVPAGGCGDDGHDPRRSGAARHPP
jgi:hypothetical protein